MKEHDKALALLHEMGGLLRAFSELDADGLTLGEASLLHKRLEHVRVSWRQLSLAVEALEPKRVN